MGNLTYDDIVKYKNSIDNNKDNFNIIMNNYISNVNSIDSNIKEINFDNWKDPVSDVFDDYIDYLNTGVVNKLNNSISNTGSLRKLKELVQSLYDQCSKYISNFEGVKTKYGDMNFDSSNKLSYVNEENADLDLLVNLNRDFSSQRDIINNTLNELRSLKFDTIVDFSTSYATLPDIYDYKVKGAEPVVINQFDIVKVYIEGRGYVDMYYLGTDYLGRSYFSETLDDDAIAYRAVVPGMGSTAQSWLTDADTLSMPGGVDAVFAFVIFGGNTGDMTKGDVLRKIGSSYANGQYVGSNKFNESISFENPSIAPEIVARSQHTTDTSRTYYAVDFDNLETVSLEEAIRRGFNSDEHPNITLEPGQKIISSYQVFWFIYDHNTIGSDSKSVTLIWNEEKQAYYVLGENGYSTFVDYEGIYYITLDKLKDSEFRL